MVEAIRIWFGVSDVDGNVDDVLGLELRNRRNSFLVWLARVTASNTSVGEMLLLLTVVIDGGGGIIWKRGGGGRCGGKTDVAGKTESNEWMILCGVGGVALDFGVKQREPAIKICVRFSIQDDDKLPF